jgi:hypothetical protein
LTEKPPSMTGVFLHLAGYSPENAGMNVEAMMA